MIHHASTEVVMIITTIYFVFAGYLWAATDWSKVPNDRATPIVYLVIVFLFCGLSGYASTLIPDGWEHKTLIREIIHWILACMSLGLLLTANHIVGMLEGRK